MSRTRTIKPGFFRSESLSHCSVEARLTFAGLWTEADDEGRGDATPRLLAAALWPWDEPGDEAVRCWLDELAGTGHIVLYAHRGKRLYQIVNWSDHQSAAYRRGASTLPAPPEPETTLSDEPHEPAQQDVQESAEVCLSRAEVSRSEKKGAAAKGNPAPETTNAEDVAAAAVAMLVDYRVATTARENPAGLRFTLERTLPEEWRTRIDRHISAHPTASAADIAGRVLGVPGLGNTTTPPAPDWHANPHCEHCDGSGIARLDDIGQGTYGPCECRRTEPYPDADVIEMRWA